MVVRGMPNVRQMEQTTRKRPRQISIRLTLDEEAELVTACNREQRALAGWARLRLLEAARRAAPRKKASGE